MEEQQQQPLCALEPAEVTKPAITQSEQELSCPFCGGHAQTDYIVDVSYIIECYECEARTGSKDSAEEAIAAWNRRVRDEVAKSDDANSQKGVDV